MPFRIEYKMVNFTNWIWIWSKNACGWIANGSGTQGDTDRQGIANSPHQGPSRQDASGLFPSVWLLDDLGGVPFHLGAPFPVCKVGIMIIARNAGNQTHFMKCADLLGNLLVPLPSMITVIYDSPGLCN